MTEQDLLTTHYEIAHGRVLDIDLLLSEDGLHALLGYSKML